MERCIHGLITITCAICQKRSRGAKPDTGPPHSNSYIKSLPIDLLSAICPHLDDENRHESYES